MYICILKKNYNNFQKKMSPFTIMKDLILRCAVPYLFLKPKHLTRIIRNTESVSSLFCLNL